MPTRKQPNEDLWLEIFNHARSEVRGLRVHALDQARVQTIHFLEGHGVPCVQGKVWDGLKQAFDRNIINQRQLTLARNAIKMRNDFQYDHSGTVDFTVDDVTNAVRGLGEVGGINVQLILEKIAAASREKSGTQTAPTPPPLAAGATSEAQHSTAQVAPPVHARQAGAPQEAVPSRPFVPDIDIIDDEPSPSVQLSALPRSIEHESPKPLPAGVPSSSTRSAYSTWCARCGALDPLPHEPCPSGGAHIIGIRDPLWQQSVLMRLWTAVILGPIGAYAGILFTGLGVVSLNMLSLVPTRGITDTWPGALGMAGILLVCLSGVIAALFGQLNDKRLYSLTILWVASQVAAVVGALAARILGEVPGVIFLAGLLVLAARYALRTRPPS